MDWFAKALITASIVALLMLAARQFGQRVAGVLAGLPTVTGPALVWIAVDLGPSNAALAAVGSIAGCALCAAFAFAYVRASRRCGPWAALPIACAVGAAGLPLASLMNAGLEIAVAGAVTVVMTLYAALPAHTAPPGRRAFDPDREILVTAVVSGSISGAVALLAPEGGAFWAGVLASPPLIAALIAMRQHARHGAPVAGLFLRGYMGGLIGRIGFAAVLAWLLPLTTLPVAATLATVAGCLLTLAGMRALHPPTLARAGLWLRTGR